MCFFPPSWRCQCCCWTSAWGLSLCFSQVYKCSPFSRTPSQKAVPAATGRSRTATCWRPSISTGTRTASSVPAATAGWARWAPRSTPKPTSSCAGETTYGKKDSWRLHSVCVTNAAYHPDNTQSAGSVCRAVRELPSHWFLFTATLSLGFALWPSFKFDKFDNYIFFI